MARNTQIREKHKKKTKSIKLEQQKKPYISIIPYLKTVKQMEYNVKLYTELLKRSNKSQNA